MELSDTDRNRLKLWMRWDITFDWFGYTNQMKRLHLAMLLDRRAKSTREWAAITGLPQTSVRRQIALLEHGNTTIQVGEDGVEISELGFVMALTFHQELTKFVRGGRHMDKKLVELMKRAPGTDHMNFEMMDNHIWWPIIDASEIDDA